MFFNTLSGRFLGLTIIFVMIAEVLIFVPSVARFRQDYLQNRLELAQLAALALLASPEDMVMPEFEAELLDTADVLNVVLRRDGVRELVLKSQMPPGPYPRFNLVEADSFAFMRDALAVYFQPDNRVINVVGRSDQGDRNEVEFVLNEGPLREAMFDFGLRVLYLSLAISISTAALLFFSVQRFIVRPISRVVDNMSAYRDNPEDASRIITPQDSVLEVREAETALHDLQIQLTGALRQKERLAALGGAVAKISHDLRNLLTTAQLLADRIDMSADPGVKRTAPKLVSSLSRAISLCERTLTFGKAEETQPEMTTFLLAPLAEEVVENEAQAVPGAGIQISVNIPEDLNVVADADQLFRVLTNLVRNAAQAIEGSGEPGSINIEARDCERGTDIRITDTGPGLPSKTQENLFKPFTGSVRKGGSGLGLAIASELVRGHGGSLDLENSGSEGTTFLIQMPKAPA